MENDFQQDPQAETPEAIQTPEQPSAEIQGFEPGAPAAPTGKLPGLLQLVGKTWSIFKKRISTLIIALLAGLILIIASFAVFFGIGMIPALVISKSAALIIAILLAGTASLMAFFILQIALVIAVVDPGSSVKDCYLRAWSKFGPLLWLFTVLALVILGGAFLFIVPGILYAVWFMFAVYIFMAEDIHGMDALARSRYYVQGRWFGVFWRIAVFLIVTSIISNIPFIGWILSPLMLLLQVVFFYVLYQELKATRGGLLYIPGPKFKKVSLAVGIIGLLYIPILAVLFGGPALFKNFGAVSSVFTGNYFKAPVPPGFEYYSAANDQKAANLFKHSAGAAAPAGFVYTISVKENIIQKADSAGNVLEKWTKGGEGKFDKIVGIAADSKGNIYIAQPQRLEKYDAEGSLLAKWEAGPSKGAKPAFTIAEIALDTSGSLYVLDINNDRVLKAIPPLLAIKGMKAAIEQIPQYGRLFGTVINARKNPVAGAAITLVQKAVGKYRTLTDADGIFSVPDALLGTYEIKLVKKGYKIMIKPVEVKRDSEEIQFILIKGK